MLGGGEEAEQDTIGRITEENERRSDNLNDLRKASALIENFDDGLFSSRELAELAEHFTIRINENLVSPSQLGD